MKVNCINCSIDQFLLLQWTGSPDERNFFKLVSSPWRPTILNTWPISWDLSGSVVTPKKSLLLSSHEVYPTTCWVTRFLLMPAMLWMTFRILSLFANIASTCMWTEIANLQQVAQIPLSFLFSNFLPPRFRVCSRALYHIVVNSNLQSSFQPLNLIMVHNALSL